MRLSTPTHGPFYSQTLDGFDVRGQTPRRRWTLNDAEKTRTGIERLVIDEDPQNKGGAFLRDQHLSVPGPQTKGGVFLRDQHLSLPDADYSTVKVEIEVGLDLLTETIHLEQKPAKSGKWRLVRPPHLGSFSRRRCFTNWSRFAVTVTFGAVAGPGDRRFPQSTRRDERCESLD